jgi:hypothetical protein
MSRVVVTWWGMKRTSMSYEAVCWGCGAGLFFMVRRTGYVWPIVLSGSTLHAEIKDVDI